MLAAKSFNPTSDLAALERWFGVLAQARARAGGAPRRAERELHAAHARRARRCFGVLAHVHEAPRRPAVASSSPPIIPPSLPPLPGAGGAHGGGRGAVQAARPRPGGALPVRQRAWRAGGSAAQRPLSLFVVANQPGGPMAHQRRASCCSCSTPAVVCAVRVSGCLAPNGCKGREGQRWSDRPAVTASLPTWLCRAPQRRRAPQLGAEQGLRHAALCGWHTSGGRHRRRSPRALPQQVSCASGACSEAGRSAPGQGSCCLGARARCTPKHASAAAARSRAFSRPPAATGVPPRRCPAAAWPLPPETLQTCRPQAAQSPGSSWPAPPRLLQPRQQRRRRELRGSRSAAA